ncbi:MAG: type II secretion system protein [Hyphomicrobiales bacterium]
MRRERSGGFTAVELAIVLVALGIIAAIAIPSYVNLVREVRAGQAIADIQALRAAVYLYYGDHGSWPPEAQAGAIPTGLDTYLPKGMIFFRRYYNLDYENWIVPSTSGGSGGGSGTGAGSGTGKSQSKYPSTGIMVGVSIVSQDTLLVTTTQRLLANTRTVRMAPKRATLVIADENGF